MKNTEHKRLVLHSNLTISKPDILVAIAIYFAIQARRAWRFFTIWSRKIDMCEQTNSNFRCLISATASNSSIQSQIKENGFEKKQKPSFLLWRSSFSRRFRNRDSVVFFGLVLTRKWNNKRVSLLIFARPGHGSPAFISGLNRNWCDLCCALSARIYRKSQCKNMI